MTSPSTTSFSIRTREFSWKTAAFHAGLVVVGVFVAGFAFLAWVSPKDPEALGAATGQFAVFMGLIALAASYAIQTGKIWLALSLAAVSAILVLATLGTVLLVRSGVVVPPQVMTEAERKPPREIEFDGRAYLCHEALGFHLPSPGDGYEVDPEMQAELHAAVEEDGLGDEMEMWPFGHPATDAWLIIKAMKGLGAELNFRAFAQTYKQTVLAETGLTHHTDMVKWTADGGEFRLMGLLQDNQYFQARCLSSGEAWPSANPIVCVEGFTFETLRLSDVVDGFELGSCPGVDG